ncbi:hypothetical protein NQ317_002096 [Molorchus minor]|uniref:FYVE-type domain-containing protein n=1 Tax=Molorchus minor TaxID=1323400 RepID=A0ABQ9JVP7_9CUCU|nr:hypothetical protein NQ317_002096 [Molorchus minor]
MIINRNRTKERLTRRPFQMDKYTVDLDQVLNDFEYSELTDQYTNSTRNTACSTANLLQNNVTKHSINNVFHSLNEYLNTNINTADNNIIHNDIEALSLDNFKDVQSIKDCNLKTEQVSLDFNGEVKNIKTVDSNVEISDEAKTIDSRDGGRVILDFNAEIRQNDKLTHRNIESSDAAKTIDNRNVVVGEICERGIGSGDGEIEIVGETKDVYNLEEMESNIGEMEKESMEQTNDEDISDDTEESEENDNREEKEVISEIPNEIDVVEDLTRRVETVGFSDDIDLDDSEIIKLLEELENGDIDLLDESQNVSAEGGYGKSDTTETLVDISSETDEYLMEKKQCENNKVTEDLVEISKGPVGNLMESKEHQECVEGTRDEVKVGNNLADSKGVVENQTVTVQQEENLQEIQEEIEEAAVENYAEAKDNQVDVDKEPVGLENDPTVKNIEDAATKIQEPEIRKEIVEKSHRRRRNFIDGIELGTKSKEKCINDDKTEEIKECPDELEMEKDTSQDLLSRPQNLSLATQKEEPKRKINLIGDPGSTPYNNVYVNKEIPKGKNREFDSDSEYSTSSSPTFSDVSTTASTVSLDEVQNQLEIPSADTEIKSNHEIDDDNPAAAENVTATGSASETDRPTSVNPASDPERVDSLIANLPESEAGVNLPEANANDEVAGAEGQNVGNIGDTAFAIAGKQWLGKEAPLWIPDSDAMTCLHCDMKFTVLKRRHHCRACGLVLCSKCCHLRFRLEYLDAEARVCNKCHDILNRDGNSSSGSELSPDQGNSPSHRPNPNNPLEYCSTVSPLQQAAGISAGPPAVMVPRGRSNKGKSNKSVMFCDGIRPGSDLTNLDNDFDYNNAKSKVDKTNVKPPKTNRNLPVLDPETNTFIPIGEADLPPTVTICKTDICYTERSNGPSIVETLKKRTAHTAWCFSTEGLINVGQDEIVLLLEYIEESFVPKDVFFHISNVYNDAVKGNSVKELGLSLHNTSNFLNSKNHAGFVYVRPTFQCLENVIKPKDPYLIGLLIHRWETPWAKLFPLRLILRLGAEYRYYPSPIISTRYRESVFVEIGHTIINLLADFRNFSYTLPQIRGLTIHMEAKNTTITIPANRYDQVTKSMNNSSDHILAFAGNFSTLADSHLVCIQDTQGNENCYSTHAINIHNKPRKITGASFIVFNGALKSSSGLTAKSNIVEDGLMIQILPEHMQQIRESLRAMKNHTISCGCVNADSDETVNIVWGENDVNFNVGIVSAIDDMSLSGIPSIRVHNGKNHVCINGSRLIRWTEVFIIKDPVDISRVSENIAKATCDALVKYLDLLVANSCQKIAIRTSLQVDNVSYLAGSNGGKLAPIYMKSLDDELIPVLHRITTGNLGESAIVLELIFRILNV